MPKRSNHNGHSEDRIVRPEKFNDSSELIELEGGTLLLRESKHAKTEAPEITSGDILAGAGAVKPEREVRGKLVV